MTPVSWVLAALAVWRVTLLVVADEITRPAREALLRRWAGGRVDYLLSCPWCASIWVAPVVVGSGLAWGDGWGWQLGAASLGFSALAGLLSSIASPDG